MNDQNHEELTEAEIDEVIISQANDNSAWEEPIEVQVDTETTFSLPAAMAARAAFFAQLHNMPDAESWLHQIIQERLAFEESAFSDIKRVMEARASYRT